ncbi:MAG TPA: hypothetical protein VER08_06225 [Pyrinomonadaceae bacterium]|nr:hypothetical protein [Pyrinomonadaceae bacterium]
MKRATLLTPVLLAACALSAACGGGNEPAAPAPSDGRSAATPSPSPASSSSRDTLPVTSAHGGLAQSPSGGGSPQTPGGPAAQPASAEKPEMATPELDKKIAAAEAKAKRAGASAADKRAAAAAYFERGDLFFRAQSPRLYRFALGDLRRTLRYQPDHAEAQAYVTEIERIYRSMGRPIPTNGLEP